MPDSESQQKARVLRAAEMTRRALERKDQAAVNAWLKQFTIEVNRLNEIRDGEK